MIIDLPSTPGHLWFAKATSLPGELQAQLCAYSSGADQGWRASQSGWELPMWLENSGAKQVRCWLVSTPPAICWTCQRVIFRMAFSGFAATQVERAKETPNCGRCFHRACNAAFRSNHWFFSRSKCLRKWFLESETSRLFREHQIVQPFIRPLIRAGLGVLRQ